MTAVIKTHNLSKTYQMGDSYVRALDEVSLTVARGAFIALMGTSGSGKSTLMHLLGCLDTPSSGSYYLNGQDVSRLSRSQQSVVRNQHIGFIFQTFNLLARLTTLENVALPLLYRGRTKNVSEAARVVLQRVGLAERANHRPTELSGGQRQRVAIARALITDPALILADEPTGNLDSHTGTEIMTLLTELHQEGRTIILVTHDAHIATYAQHTLRMKDGQIEGTENGTS
jgi:putative ABC transport system ATP-binding protein